MTREPPRDRLAALRGEVALACDAAGRLTWVDEWADCLLGARVGATLPSLMAEGGEEKAARLVEAVRAGPVQDWELTGVVRGCPAVLSFRGEPYGDGALLVGTVVAANGQGMLEQVHTTLSELATLHRESARQQYEIGRLYAEAQQARADAETAVQVRNAFLAVVAHDLKHPLAVIKGRAQLMLRRMRRDPERAAEAAGLEILEAQTDAMRRLLDQLLDVSRLDVGQQLTLQRAPVDLGALVEQVVAQQVALGHTHPIHVTGTDEALIGEWDADRIERVVANLLSNAIKYSPPESPIQVRLAREADAAGAWAVLAVADVGVGIPAADLPHIFEQFHRGSNVVDQVPGMGIGLAGARRIVEQHGGSLTVASAEGQGSTFTVRLPLGPARATAG
jgi:signal transduction histidine kinase